MNVYLISSTLMILFAIFVHSANCILGTQWQKILA